MKRSAAITVLAMTLGVLPACSPHVENSPNPTPTLTTADPTPSPTPSDSPTTATPDPDPSPTPTETLDADQQAARDVVLEFFEVQQSLKQDPAKPMQELADITTGNAQDLYLTEVTRIREQGLVQVGDLSWRVLQVGAPSSTDGEAVVQVSACTDNSNIDVIEIESGESVLPADRTRVINWSLQVASVNNHWLVADGTTSSGKECLT